MIYVQTEPAARIEAKSGVSWWCRTVGNRVISRSNPVCFVTYSVCFYVISTWMVGSLCFGQPHGHWGREDMHRVRAAAGRLAGVLGVKIENAIVAGVVAGLGGLGARYIYTKEQHITVLPLSRKTRGYPLWDPSGQMLHECIP